MKKALVAALAFVLVGVMLVNGTLADVFNQARDIFVNLGGSLGAAIVLMGLELAPQALHVQLDEEEEGHHGGEDDDHRAEDRAQAFPQGPGQQQGGKGQDEGARQHGQDAEVRLHVAVEAAAKALERIIKSEAKDIRDKYIEPPYTTDFAILFLPFESIYAEVIRRTALIETLQKDFKVVVTGPTTLGAILNSLQMGFRTLAIQKRTSEVWSVLGAVKTEFGKFGGMLEKVQKNLQSAGDQLEEVMGKRTRAIERKLRQVEALPTEESRKMLDFNELADEEE